MNSLVTSKLPDPPHSVVVPKASTAPPSRAPILLANGDFYGTLAATRSLGEQGIPVFAASHRLLSASRWSRRSARAIRCPPLSDTNRFVDWLGELGEAEPGIVLYPTSDETAFLYALHREQLSRSFQMYAPEVDSILDVLDKKRLYATAREIGLEVPETWFPDSDADVERIARDAPMPLLIKPRTQVLSHTHSKGVIVRERSELVARYRAFVRASRYGHALVDCVPDAAQAMIQRYLPEAAKRIYVLAAFIDRGGRQYVARAGRKIFQQPRSLGIGLCFESAEPSPHVLEGSRRLARATGYFGLFQLEFIEAGDRHLLIDFNPRFYNQLAFDMARGLPLARIVHAAACGSADEMARLVAAGQSPPKGAGLVFCNEFALGFMLATQRAVGRISAEEARHWRLWKKAHEGSLIDPAFATGDPLPAVVDVATQLYGHLRHPRAFVRNVLFDGALG